MNTLVIETSTERGGLALVEFTKSGPLSLVEEHLPFGYQSSHTLLPRLHELLQKNGGLRCRPSFITLGIGPGSYTGMRVGAAVAKTLAYAWRLPLVGVTSLKAYCPENDGPFLAAFDAKIGGAYLLAGLRQGDSVVWKDPPRLMPLELLPGEWTEVVHLVTPQSTLEARLQTAGLEPPMPWTLMQPNLSQLAAEGYKAYVQELGKEPRDIPLLYLRPTQAEMELHGT